MKTIRDLAKNAEPDQWDWGWSLTCGIAFFKKRFYLFIFRGRGREGEREGEKHQCVVASHTPATGDLAHNPGMCPDWESNRWPFGLQLMLNPLSYTSQSEMWHFWQTWVLVMRLVPGPHFEWWGVRVKRHDKHVAWWLELHRCAPYGNYPF